MFTEQVTLKAIVQRIYYFIIYYDNLLRSYRIFALFLSNKAHISLGKTRDLWYGF